MAQIVSILNTELIEAIHISIDTTLTESRAQL